MSLLERFNKNIVDKSLCAKDDTLLLAVSGGVDSMVMANIFVESSFNVIVGHCNFQLRGEGAKADQELVREWCANNNVKFFTTSFDTKLVSKEWKKGIQETARILRYEWLNKIKEENGCRYIVTAHHANDNVETVLMNLFKGTGIAGLHGILPKSNGVIRPLLFAQKEEIEEYAKEQGVVFREDESNKSDKYLRNALRLNLIPEIEKQIPNVISNVSNTIDKLNDVELLYNRQIHIELKKLKEERRGDIYISTKKLALKVPLSTICYELIKPYSFSSAQVDEVLKLLNADSGHYIDSTTHRIIKDREFLIITTLETKKTGTFLINEDVSTITADGCSFKFDNVKSREVKNNSNTAYIDASRLEYPLLLRRWKEGDYFYPLGMGMKKKKLSKFFKDIKLAINEKDKVWVLESNKRIVWVASHRLDERFKVKESTNEILIVEMKDA